MGEDISKLPKREGIGQNEDVIAVTTVRLSWLSTGTNHRTHRAT